MTDPVPALARALHAVDTSRRVGWARAYSAESSKDELAREVNMMRAERDILYRYASFLHGFLRGMSLGNRADAAISRYQAQIGAVLDPEITKAGHAAAMAHRKEGCSPEEQERRDRAEAAKKKRHKDSQLMFKTARQHQLKILMRTYGFPNEAALFNHLDGYRQ